MSREGMLGRLPLALYGLANDRLDEALEVVTLLSGKESVAWKAYLGRIREAGLPDRKNAAANETVPRNVAWTNDEEGNVCFTVTSNGKSGDMWADYIQRLSSSLGEEERAALSQSRDAPTVGVAYNVVVGRKKTLSSNGSIPEIRAAAEGKVWKKPHWEVACLIRATFADWQLTQMGFSYIVTMHEPLRDSNNIGCVLRTNCVNVGRRFRANPEEPTNVYERFGNGGGFAFVL